MRFNLKYRALKVVFLMLVAGEFKARAFEALPQSPLVPKDNLMTPGKVELGKKLYFDPRISKTGTVSCNSCHNVMLGGEDNRAVSIGINGLKGGRSSPTVWNSAFNSVQFWDGRATSLEEQAKGPMTNPVEMGMENHETVMNRLKSIPGYVIEFEKVYGKDSLNIDNVAKAIASYERTLVTPDSLFDRFQKGDKKALSDRAQRGMKLVQKVGCLACHSGPNFNGPVMPAGQGFYQKFPLIPGSEYETKYELTKDEGRFAVTKKEQDKNFWRIPTWRNVALTAPYFHNGSVKTLSEAVKVMAKTQLGKTLEEKQVEDIVEFLNSLTGKFPEQKLPQLPPTVSSTLLDG